MYDTNTFITKLKYHVNYLSTIKPSVITLLNSFAYMIHIQK